MRWWWVRRVEWMVEKRVGGLGEKFGVGWGRFGFGGEATAGVDCNTRGGGVVSFGKRGRRLLYCPLHTQNFCNRKKGILLWRKEEYVQILSPPPQVKKD